MHPNRVQKIIQQTVTILLYSRAARQVVGNQPFPVTKNNGPAFYGKSVFFCYLPDLSSLLIRDTALTVEIGIHLISPLFRIGKLTTEAL